MSLTLRTEMFDFENPAHHEILKTFVEKRGGKAPDVRFLPPTGFIIFLFEQPLCVGFQIRCDNGTVINTDLIADSEIPKDLRNLAVMRLRNALNNEAKAAGYKVVTVFTSIEKHEARLKTLGYIEADRSLTQLVRAL